MNDVVVHVKCLREKNLVDLFCKLENICIYNELYDTNGKTIVTYCIAYQCLISAISKPIPLKPMVCKLHYW